MRPSDAAQGREGTVVSPLGICEKAVWPIGRLVEQVWSLRVERKRDHAKISDIINLADFSLL